jgi:hypothetical protein
VTEKIVPVTPLKFVKKENVVPTPAPVSEVKVVSAPVSEEKVVPAPVSEVKVVPTPKKSVKVGPSTEKEVVPILPPASEEKVLPTLDPLRKLHESRDFKKKSFYDGHNVGKKIGPELNSQLRKAKSLTENLISEHKSNLEDGKKVLNLYRELGLKDTAAELFLFDKLVLGDGFYEYLNDYVHSKGLKLTCNGKKLLIHSRYMVLG